MKTTPFWQENLILKVLAGSQAYGLATEHSDTDSRGVCIAPKEVLLGLQTFDQVQDDKGDHVIFSLQKFVRLALEGNPNLIETLFTEDVLFVHPLGERLLEQRRIFLSRKVAERFGHYAFQQLKRLENHHRWWDNPPKEPGLSDFGATLTARGSASFPSAQAKRAYEQAHKNWTNYQRWKRERNPARAQLEERYGYDTKHAMHLCRLLKMGQEILATGEVLVKRPDAAWLRQVRQGSLAYEELLEWARNQESELRQLRDTSPLPEEPDSAVAETLLMGIIEDFHWPRS